VLNKMHIFCSKPERLTRLWMLPEGCSVRVGQTHWDVDCSFHKERVASDQRYRENFQPESIAATSTATLEEIAQGI
jgi:hypothetical protein